MAWMWRYLDQAGEPVEGPTEVFGSQSDAESWLGQCWRELSEKGVTTVRLVEDDRQEYEMSLRPTGAN
ncbi:hypothetical protein AB0I55_03255 [Actinocatenispora sera]|uniref:Uncharacterized protein n=1 Tax=Actinocatenispora sera TaxID=390989 RepID=A0A810L5B8_9ACTN|nr:hypothetical protein [Actinocatenispora sera]BCJ29531.1 hypothetical protein Asera_36390 [Actinocatenispora sera]